MMKKELGIDEIHKGTLVILKKIIDICDELGINYYMAYGSLIGAIRHHGFIPWDDDCDIIMIRKDYERFINYCKVNADKLYPFKLLNRGTCKGYPYNISRFNDMRYKAEYDEIPDYDSGMFIDIYPFDGAGNDCKKTKKKIALKKRILFRLVGWAIKSNRESTTKIKRVLRKVIIPIVKLIGADWFLNKMENLGKIYDYEDSQYISCLVWDGKLVLQDKDDFKEYIMVDFENLSVKVPKGYDRVLKNSYGDYMELPPKNERTASHGYRLYIRE